MELDMQPIEADEARRPIDFMAKHLERQPGGADFVIRIECSSGEVRAGHNDLAAEPHRRCGSNEARSHAHSKQPVQLSIGDRFAGSSASTPVRLFDTSGWGQRAPAPKLFQNFSSMSSERFSLRPRFASQCARKQVTARARQPTVIVHNSEAWIRTFSASVRATRATAAEIVSISKPTSNQIRLSAGTGRSILTTRHFPLPSPCGRGGPGGRGGGPFPDPPVGGRACGSLLPPRHSLKGSLQSPHRSRRGPARNAGEPIAIRRTPSTAPAS